MYFDTHTHYDEKNFPNNKFEIIENLKNNNVTKIVNIGYDFESSKESVDIAKKYDFVYASVGYHPHDVKNLNNNILNEIEKLAKNKKVVAIGEIGLDFYRNNSPKDLQVLWFKKQLDLAKKLDLPVIIHSRDACAETFEILKQSNIKSGIIHCYSGSKELAVEYVKLGFLIGVGGVVTYKNAKKLVQTVNTIPLENIVLETDCPYLTPEPFRGKKNESKYLKYICDKIAEIKDIESNKVAKQTYLNSIKLFRI